MLPFEDRYTRQRQLVEVGLEGQVRLETSTYKLAALRLLPTAAAQVATDYLQRAGVRVESSSVEPLGTTESKPVGQDFPSWPRELFRFEGPLLVATGALAALDHIRWVLGVGRDP